MYKYLFPYKIKKEDIIELINQVDTDRKKLRSINEKLITTFAEDLKLLINIKYL